MIFLILGLVIFLGPHSVRIFANDWRNQQVARMGEGKWKGIFSVISLIGLILIIYGYDVARADPTWLWVPPVWTRHLAALLLLPAFVLLVAAYVPHSKIRARLGHPMVAGVKIWALAHLIANGTVADVVLFGSFLVWAIADFAVSRRRDRVNGVVRPGGKASADVTAVILGIVAWAIFGMVLHGPLIGVSPFAVSGM